MFYQSYTVCCYHISYYFFFFFKKNDFYGNINIVFSIQFKYRIFNSVYVAKNIDRKVLKNISEIRSANDRLLSTCLYNTFLWMRMNFVSVALGRMHFTFTVTSNRIEFLKFLLLYYSHCISSFYAG